MVTRGQGQCQGPVSRPPPARPACSTPGSCGTVPPGEALGPNATSVLGVGQVTLTVPPPPRNASAPFRVVDCCDRRVQPRDWSVQRPRDPGGHGAPCCASTPCRVPSPLPNLRPELSRPGPDGAPVCGRSRVQLPCTGHLMHCPGQHGAYLCRQHRAPTPPPGPAPVCRTGWHHPCCAGDGNRPVWCRHRRTVDGCCVCKCPPGHPCGSRAGGG